MHAGGTNLGLNVISAGSNLPMSRTGVLEDEDSAAPTKWGILETQDLQTWAPRNSDGMEKRVYMIESLISNLVIPSFVEKQ